MAIQYGGLPFQEALDFFQKKLAIPTARWDDILKAAHDRAFVVAGAMKADLLADLKAAVTRAISEGTTVATFRKDFERIVAKYGWTGWTGEDTPGGRAWRTRIIYDTNVFSSYAAGRYQQLKDVTRSRPYWRYRHSDAVVTPRVEHLAWDGKILRHNDRWWNTHFPPNGFGCQCRVESLSNDDLERLGVKVTSGKDMPYGGTQEVKNREGKLEEIPEGVDYGWDYVPGENFAEWKKVLLDSKIERLFGKEPPVAIAYGAEPDAIDKVLEDFLQNFGEEIPPFKILKRMTGPRHFAMATWGEGTYAIAGDPYDNEPLLKSALEKIRMGAELHVDEEEMIEVLWHEICHNRQKYAATRESEKGSINDKLMEATNEFIAQRTYPDFLRSLGGKASHEEDVRWRSFYSLWVTRLEEVIITLGLNVDDQLPLIERVSFTKPIDAGNNDDILNHLSVALAAAGREAGWKGLSNPQVRAVLSLIGAEDEDYSAALLKLAKKKPDYEADGII